MLRSICVIGEAKELWSPLILLQGSLWAASWSTSDAFSSLAVNLRHLGKGSPSEEFLYSLACIGSNNLWNQRDMIYNSAFSQYEQNSPVSFMYLSLTLFLLKNNHKILWIHTYGILFDLLRTERWCSWCKSYLTFRTMKQRQRGHTINSVQEEVRAEYPLHIERSRGGASGSPLGQRDANV